MARKSSDRDGVRKNAKEFTTQQRKEVREDLSDWVVYKYTVGALPGALGLKGADEQVKGSLVLIGWSWTTSLFTGGATLGFIALWSVFLLIGIFRWSSIPGRVKDNVGSAKKYSRRRE